MTGRNDPCPCGSGKKSKKCCDGAKPARKYHVESESQKIKKIPLPVFHRIIAPHAAKEETQEPEKKS
jgi:hypothetical protein